VTTGPVQEKLMSTNTLETQELTEVQASRPKRKPAAKKASPRRRRWASKKGARKPNRANKKAEVIALMKRVKGATLAEIMNATGWQAHTVRGFVSILGSKGGRKIESAKNDAGERSYHIAVARAVPRTAAFRFAPGAAFLFVYAALLTTMPAESPLLQGQQLVRSFTPPFLQNGGKLERAGDGDAVIMGWRHSKDANRLRARTSDTG
jgi:hypothetical protein